MGGGSTLLRLAGRGFEESVGEREQLTHTTASKRQAYASGHTVIPPLAKAHSKAQASAYQCVQT
jgi:hypothetical protein